MENDIFTDQIHRAPDDKFNALRQGRAVCHDRDIADLALDPAGSVARTRRARTSLSKEAQNQTIALTRPGIRGMSSRRAAIR
jgi:hypothetical protein